MASRSVVRNLFRDRFVVVTILGIMVIAGLLIRRSFKEESFPLKLSAGSALGLRHQVAEGLVPGSRTRGVTLTLVPSAGSEKALDDVEAGRIDLALVQGGLGLGHRENVQQLAALHIEPLHVLVKEELLARSAEGLEILRGRTINIGENGSGTHLLAIDVLRFVGLERNVDYRAELLSYDSIEREGSRDKLPDAVFMVSLLPSRLARKLVTKHRYRLVSLPFAEAYSIATPELGSDSSESSTPIDRDHVVECVIPAFTYGVRPAVPPEALRTLGTRMLLVANRNVPAEAGARILETAFTTPFAHLSHPPLSPDLLSQPTEFPVHAGLLMYQERSKPMFAGDVIDAIEKQVSIGGAVLGGAFFLWQWLKVRFRRMRESGFEHYILRVAAIEQKALHLELEATLDLPSLLTLQDQLGKLKAEAISKFAEGELEGEDLLSGFLAQASDVRDHLTRLILHRRDDLERKARKEKRDAVVLWREALERPQIFPSSADAAISMPDH